MLRVKQTTFIRVTKISITPVVAVKKSQIRSYYLEYFYIWRLIAVIEND